MFFIKNKKKNFHFDVVNYNFHHFDRNNSSKMNIMFKYCSNNNDNNNNNSVCLQHLSHLHRNDLRLKLATSFSTYPPWFFT